MFTPGSTVWYSTLQVSNSGNGNDAPAPLIVTGSCAKRLLEKLAGIVDAITSTATTNNLKPILVSIQFDSLLLVINPYTI
jgi:hypothetical protein